MKPSVKETCANLLKEMKSRHKELDPSDMRNDPWGHGYNIGYGGCIEGLEDIIQDLETKNKKIKDVKISDMLMWVKDKSNGKEGWISFEKMLDHFSNCIIEGLEKQK